MSSRLYTFVAALLLSLQLALAQTAVVDDLGREVALDAPPARVVSMLPSHTESVCALGACDLLVGIDNNTDLEGLGDLPRLGDPFAPDVEAIVALEPDLVLVDEYSGMHASLEELGIPTYAGSPQTVEETYAFLATLGRLLGREDEAAELVESVQGELAEVGEALRGVDRPTVFVEVDPTPYSAGPGSYLDELLTLAGGENVVPASLGPFPQVDPEFVVLEDPEVVLLLDAPFGVTAAQVGERPGWGDLSAVTGGRVYELTDEQADALSRPGPRLGEAVRLLARLLHPELF
ncbi:MAG TPA: ABC transporter substrate-binding protein [Trueperaceae bacterium]|jgi:iron complex transport system substrate-binding protein